MPRARSHRARRPDRRVTRIAPPVAPVVTVLPGPRSGRVALDENPHSHIVCRVCGRIQEVELTELDRHLLTELAASHPDGWSVDRIAFSLTGACRSCREGSRH